MGNTPSSEGPRQASHKLSKPRVGNHASAAGLLSPNGASALESAPNSKSYFASASSAPSPGATSIDTIPLSPGLAVTGEEAEGRPVPSRRDSRRSLKRMSGLFRSNSSRSSQPSRRLSLLGPSARPSRANSMVQPDTIPPVPPIDSLYSNGNRGSVHYDLASYESQRLLNLHREDPAETRTETVEPDNYFETAAVATITWNSAIPPPSATTSVTRTNSDMSLYVPMRRRSMIQTPGVATRAPHGQFHISARSGCRNSHPTTPGSPSRQNSTQSSAARRMSMPPEPFAFDFHDHVVTPCENDYKQLGAMKFGSLRITNGDPVLSPNDEDTTAATPAKTGHSQDYFVRNKSPSTIVSVGSKEVEPEDAAKATNTDPPTLKVISPVFAFDRTYTTGRVSPARVDDDEAISPKTEVAGMPSIHSKPQPELQNTSKHTAQEHQSFEDDASLQEYSSYEILEVREDPNAKPRIDTARAEAANKTIGVLTRSDSGLVSSPSSEVSRQTLSKADSGYSSNISLRSFKSSRLAGTDQGRRSPEKKITEKKSNSLPLELASNSTDNDRDNHRPSSGSPALPPPQEDTPTSPLRNAFSVSRGGIRMPSFRQNKAQESESMQAGSSFRHRRAMSVDSVSGSPALLDKSSLALSIGSGSRKGRLHRFLSGAGMKGPPMVHDTHAIGKSVPSVPVDVEEKLQEHNGRFPTASKRLALRLQPSKETLKTIFSVGSTDLLQCEESMKTEREQEEPQQPAQESKPSRTRSIQAASDSFALAATSFLTLRKGAPKASDDPTPTICAVKESVHSSQEVDVDQEQLPEHGVKVQGQHPSSPRVTSVLTKPRPIIKRSQAQLPALRLRASAPDIHVSPLSPLDTSIPDLPPIKKNKTPPPVSFCTQSSRNLRLPLRSRAGPTSEGPSPVCRPTASRNNSRESIHSYPSAQGHNQLLDSYLFGSPQQGTCSQQPTPFHAGSILEPDQSSALGLVCPGNPVPVHQLHVKQLSLRQQSICDEYGYGQSPKTQDHGMASFYEQQQPSGTISGHYDGNTRQVLRKHHQRRRSAGSQGSLREQKPPYRVLHSYNSPAYRGAPIWG